MKKTFLIICMLLVGIGMTSARKYEDNFRREARYVDTIHIESPVIVYKPGRRQSFIMPEHLLKRYGTKSRSLLRQRSCYILEPMAPMIIGCWGLEAEIRRLGIDKRLSDSKYYSPEDTIVRKRSCVITKFRRNPDYYHLILVEGRSFNDAVYYSQNCGYLSKPFRFKDSRAYYKVLIPAWYDEEKINATKASKITHSTTNRQL